MHFKVWIPLYCCWARNQLFHFSCCWARIKLCHFSENLQQNQKSFIVLIDAELRIWGNHAQSDI